MQKFKKILIGLGALSALSIPFAIVSCNNEKQNINNNIEKNDTLRINISSTGDSTADKNIQAEFEKLFKEKLESVGIKNVIVSFSDGGYEITKQNITKGQYDLAFVSAGSLYNAKDDLLNNHIKPFLQTQTLAFKGDLTDSSYSEGTNSLENIAQEENTLFNKIPWSAQWNDQTNGNNWNGAIYESFYDMSKLVGFQRGVLWIEGDTNTINSIKEAWNNKDWNSFKQYGILVSSDVSSGSKYLLIDNLLKQHFNKTGNSFTTLASEIINNPNNIKQTKHPLKDRTLNTNFHIFADNEGSYSWTHYKEEKKSLYAAPEGQTLQLLVVTNPLPYNVGLINFNKFSSTQIQAIQNVFVNLTKEENTWGIDMGFNGYEPINDMQDFWNRLNNALD